MIHYVLRRMFLLLFVLFSLSVLTFSLSFLFPGDPLNNLSGYQDITVNELAMLEDKYKINSDYFTQYIALLRRIFILD
ncbi:MAG: ABC transporter permease, partial [Psychrosphaera sp.]|nr:ABC transporter permease [Psychrosphaera sp.]